MEKNFLLHSLNIDWHFIMAVDRYSIDIILGGIEKSGKGTAQSE
jgi:hypothetical protein